MKRIQRKRTKGWRMPDGVIYVGRPSMWGNPFKDDNGLVVIPGDGKLSHIQLVLGSIDELGGASKVFRDMLMDLNSHKVPAPIYRKMRLIRDRITDLGGKDLACWCSLDKSCHADALIELCKTYK